MKNNLISKSLLLVRQNAKRRSIALLLGFATFSVAVGGMSSTTRAQDVPSAPVQGTWLNTITRINQGGATFTAVASFAAGGVWQATGENDRQTGGVSTLFGSWKRIGENLYSSRAYFFAFDPSGNPVVLLRVDQIQKLKNKIDSKELSRLRLFTTRQRPRLRENSGSRHHVHSRESRAPKPVTIPTPMTDL